MAGPSVRSNPTVSYLINPSDTDLLISLFMVKGSGDFIGTMLKLKLLLSTKFPIYPKKKSPITVYHQLRKSTISQGKNSVTKLASFIEGMSNPFLINTCDLNLKIPPAYHKLLYIEKTVILMDRIPSDSRSS